MSSFATSDGTRLTYSSLGEGHPLVCLPGGPGRAVSYLEDLGGLDRSRTLLLLDPRATGHSEVPADPATLRFDRMAEDLEAMREHLGRDTIDVLAHSAGCLVAQAWASRYPERVGHLVLVTPSDRLQGGNRDDVQAIRASRSAEPWYAEAAAAQDELEQAPPAQRAMLERATRPFFYAHWDERTQEHAAGADHQSSKRALLGFGGDPEELDVDGLRAGLQQVTAPVLVLGGAKDGLTGVSSCHLVAQSFRNVRTVILDDAGHFPWVDRPEAFASAVADGLRSL